MTEKKISLLTCIFVIIFSAIFSFIYFQIKDTSQMHPRERWLYPVLLVLCATIAAVWTHVDTVREINHSSSMDSSVE